MKYIAGFAVVALASFSSISPCLAINQSADHTFKQSLSNQSFPREGNSNLVFEEFGIFNKVANRAEREQRAAARRAAFENRREAHAQRKAAMAAEAEKRRAVAAEKAEKERQYFESLSPEDKKIHLAKLAEQRAANQQMMGAFVRMLVEGSSSNSSPSQSNDDAYRDAVQRERDNQRFNKPEPQRAPAPVAPISDFYGNGPKY